MENNVFLLFYIYLNASQYDIALFSFTLLSCLNYCFMFYIVLQYLFST